ncbi:hypothetical protein [Nocardioides zeae]|uniref:Uncharacterized protein n=1 Tax=Nocardioides zeae TaxID=1457234 RepID=A0A6P0HIN9_9ACTN|nr:hypothetical protein [Nocardioides zeae]NEN78609.1 hypothetical protein [Nocardioides zeae]
MVVVDVAAGGGGVGPVVAAGDEVHPFLEGFGVFVGGGADGVGQVDDRLDGHVRGGQQSLEGAEGAGSEVFDTGDALGAQQRRLVQVDVEDRLRAQLGQVGAAQLVEEVARERGGP